MRKVVAFFQKEEDAFGAGKALTAEDFADYSVVKLSSDYEQQIRQEVFLRAKELNYTLTGAIAGMFILGALFYWLSAQNNLGIILARWMAGGLPAAVFTGAGLGMALGGLLAGVYSLSLPIGRNLTGYWMMNLYVGGPNHKERAAEIIKSHFGLFI